MKRISVAFLCLLTFALFLTGCMDSNGRTLGDTRTPNAGPQNSIMPQTTQGGALGEMTNDLTNGISNGISSITPFDWKSNAQTVQDKINQLSEIESSTVVVTGKTALVGVTFTGSYAGELTQRIRDMVAAQVQQADASIEKVAVTADKDDVAKIGEIAGKLQSGTPSGELEQEIDSIVRNVTTMS